MSHFGRCQVLKVNTCNTYVRPASSLQKLQQQSTQLGLGLRTSQVRSMVYPWTRRTRPIHAFFFNGGQRCFRCQKNISLEGCVIFFFGKNMSKHQWLVNCVPGTHTQFTVFDGKPATQICGGFGSWYGDFMWWILLAVEDLFFCTSLIEDGLMDTQARTWQVANQLRAPLNFWLGGCFSVKGLGN